MSDARYLTRVDGIYWRMKFLAEADDAIGPARAPEGRSHRDGQPALYLSETKAGCVVATRIYMRADDPERSVFDDG